MMFKTITHTVGLVAAVVLPLQIAAQDPYVHPHVRAACREATDTYDANGNPIVQRGRRYCEERELTIPPRPLLVVAGGLSGDVTIHGWRDTVIRVVSTVRAEALTSEQARDVARAVKIASTGDELKAHGPDVLGSSSWSVSFEIWVPAATNLQVTSLNGSLSVEGVHSHIQLESTNGTVSLLNVNGDVHARTSNGGVSLSLNGDRWIGVGLEASSLNGPVDVDLASGYSATLFASTATGHLTAALREGSVPLGVRTLEKSIGHGGPRLTLTTVNGPVSVHQN